MGKMNVLVLNGSPAGENSITLQTVKYIEMCYPEVSFAYLNVASRIHYYEAHFEEVQEQLREADLLLFAYPVYTFLVPSQLQRFIELIEENEIDLSGKYATQVATSKHFYDVTAFRFIEDRCRDLGMQVIRGLSADMEDLLQPQGQLDAKRFFHYVLWRMIRAPHAGMQPLVLRDGQPATVAIVTDLAPDNDRLREMIEQFREEIGGETRLINLREVNIKGGCLGCFHCAASGACIYKDGFSEVLREQIQTADATVYAFTIKDHSMGLRFKMYDDRQFCNGHRTVTMGKPVAYLIDGDYEQEFNLQMLIEARAQVGGNFLAGIALDEESMRLTEATLRYAIRTGYQEPKNFYGVGGMKIFRDLIWQMQGMMREDHRFYKEHGFYDFPQKRIGTIAGMYAVGAMMNSKSLSRKMGSKMTEGMLMPYRQALKKAQKGAEKRKKKD